MYKFEYVQIAIDKNTRTNTNMYKFKEDNMKVPFSKKYTKIL